MYDLPKQVKRIRIKRDAPATNTSPSKKSRLADDSMEYSEPLDDTRHDSDDNNEDEKVKTTDIPAPTIQFTLSSGGASLQAILNRYIYFLFSSAHVAGVRKWRCVDYKYKKADGKCPAFIVTRGNTVMYRTNPHNHGYHDKKILRKVQLKQVFSAIEDVPVSKAIPKEDDTDLNDNDDIIVVETRATDPMRQDESRKTGMVEAKEVTQNKTGLDDVTEQLTQKTSGVGKGRRQKPRSLPMV